jgi:heat shock protein HspQ
MTLIIFASGQMGCYHVIGDIVFHRQMHQIGIMSKLKSANYRIGQVVRHRIFPFRGLIFDVDPVFANTEEWYQSIPAAVRPRKDQPFYHLFAENDATEYVAYVSEQNLLPDESGEPLRHPRIAELFEIADTGMYNRKPSSISLN